ncbi:MAG: hypothetical protein HFI87_05265 [Bacilli bacterium]|nr:hypothetical protein [Bacilli bacterium]
MLNLFDTNLLETILELDERIEINTYGNMLNYYQLLGVNLDCNKTELEKNYNRLIELISKHRKYFTEQEIMHIKEGYERFSSVLGATWYEHNIGSAGAKNIQILYGNNETFEKMFSQLEVNKGNEITVKYLEQNENQFDEKKLESILVSSVSYDSIIVHVLKDGKRNGFKKIDFLGKETAIVEITNQAGETIYNNPYLASLEKRKLYNNDNLNVFRIVCYNFNNAKVIDVMENADVIDSSKEGKSAYTKKYSE